QVRSEAAAVIGQRAEALAALIEVDPAEALKLAFAEDLLGTLSRAFPGSAAVLEAHGSWKGVLEYQITDDPTMTRHQSIQRLRYGQESLEIHFAGSEPKGLKGGDIVSVRGIRAGNRVAAQDGSILGTDAVAAACSTKGAQNIVAILVNLASYTLSSGVDQELMKGILWGNDFTTKDATPNRSVDNFWYESSDHQTWAPASGGNVVGPYLLSQDYNKNSSGQTYCDYNGLKAEALQQADAEVYFPSYSRVMLIFPPNGACGWAGLGDLGCWNSGTQDGGFNASFVWERSDQTANRLWGVELATHELGHNLSMHHASSREFTDAGGARVPLGALGDAGTLTEYGDLFSTMGSWNLGYYSAHHAEQQLGWLALGANYQVVETSGLYTILPYESFGGLKALKVRRGTGNDAWLWIESRRAIGNYDSAIGSQVFGGALIHYEDSTTGTKTHLADFTPSTTSFNDPALLAGQTWADPYSNVSVRVVSVSDSGMTVEVNYGAVPCTSAAPTVTISPSNPTVQPGGSANYTVSVKNNDSTGCPAGSFNMSSTLPSGWGSSFTLNAVTVNPGETGATTMTKTAPSGTGAGTYQVNAAATKGSYSGEGTANATVPAPPPIVAVKLSFLSTGPYQTGSIVKLKAAVTNDGSPAAGAAVTFKIVKSNGSSTKSKRITTNSAGEAFWNYTIGKRDPRGNWQASATSTYNAQSVSSAPLTFTVQ
ncbi:MAG TPA: NEW3 domain-containing protein, partial [Bryobacteraceae bacterium]|nr:NEW3 domain-containing protein [Bryobacteraceae bacterium]